MGKRAGCFYFDCLPDNLLLLNALCRLFLTVPWVGLQCVIVVFPDHTRLPFQLLSHFRSARSIINLKYAVYVNAYMGQSVNDIRHVKMQIDTLYPYITVSIHCAPEMSEIDCIGRIESFWPKFMRGW